MPAESFAYWTPGSEERQLRIFISHRYGDDQPLYDEVIRALNRSGFSVQDISLSAQQVLAGPRGGALPKLEVQSEIAARIYTSDIMIAPSRPAITRSDWVTWEVQLAAIAYGVPVLFVNQRRGQQRNARLVAEMRSLDLPHAVCDPDAQQIVRHVAELANVRPTWAMREVETDAAMRFRGPPKDVVSDVLRKLPYRPRLAPLEEPEPPPRPNFWSRLIGRDHHPG